MFWRGLTFISLWINNTFWHVLHLFVELTMCRTGICFSSLHAYEHRKDNQRNVFEFQLIAYVRFTIILFGEIWNNQSICSFAPPVILILRNLIALTHLETLKQHFIDNSCVKMRTSWAKFRPLVCWYGKCSCLYASTIRTRTRI